MGTPTGFLWFKRLGMHDVEIVGGKEPWAR